MAEHTGYTNRLTEQRPRSTIGVMMLVIAMAAMWIHGYVDYTRRVIVIDVGPPDLIAIGNRLYTVESLQQKLKGQSVAVSIRCQSNVPMSFLDDVFAAVSEAKLHVRGLSLTSPGSTTNPVFIQPTPGIPIGRR
jgi:hypothetical protein